MPGYGIQPAESVADLLPWSWAVERITSSRYYWISTVRPDRRPHAMPIWGVWMDDQFWFSSSSGSRKTLNLEANPLASVTTENAAEPVVIEGTAARVSSACEPELVQAFAGASNTKYDTQFPVSFYLDNATFRVRPDRVIAMTESEFESSPTRWTFTW